MFTFYFDMDGVLVHLNEDDSVSMPFLIPGNHYYHNLEEDRLAVSLFRWFQRRPNTRAVVCTRLYYRDVNPECIDGLLREQTLDKYNWCQQHLALERTDFNCLRMTASKSCMLYRVPPERRKEHILIDDDRRMLARWCESGGSGIQYVQEHRRRLLDYLWSGPIIHASWLNEIIRECGCTITD